MAKPRFGIRVKHCENVAKKKQGGHQILAIVPDGWFIQVRYGGRWYSLMDLRFVREKDALRACQALTTAGLDTHTAMVKAGPMRVKQVATEFLQW